MPTKDKLRSADGRHTTPTALRCAEQHRGESAERLAAALLETLLNAIDATDPQTGAHVRRVARYSSILAQAAGLDEHVQHDIERVALFHDIGKIHEALFDIIHDSGKLDAADRRAILTHPQRGVEVLAPLDAFYPSLRDGVLGHHERWDGRGYPNKLRGDEIPFSARVVALGDSFDAITHSRRYHAGKSADEAIRLIGEGRGAQFDPDLTDLFLFPPVLDEIRGAMRGGDTEKPDPGDRRRGARESAPDVTFRWRSGARERQSLETRARKRRG